MCKIICLTVGPTVSSLAKAGGWLATLGPVVCQMICLTIGSPEDVATASDGPAALQVVQANRTAVLVLLVTVSSSGGHRSGGGTCTIKQAARNSALGTCCLTCSSCHCSKLGNSW